MLGMLVNVQALRAACQMITTALDGALFLSSASYERRTRARQRVPRREADRCSRSSSGLVTDVSIGLPMPERFGREF